MPIDLTAYKLFENQTIKEFKPLAIQGYCNINYLLETQENRYLIRKFKLTNDRESEFKIQKLIATKNIGARPLLLDESKGLMIAEFIEGKHKTNPNSQELKKLALLIKKLHHIKTRQKQSKLRKNFQFKDKKALKAFIKLQSYKQEPVLCHNDLHDKNILFGKTVKLIDWEYAGTNDRYFDLASIIIEFKLNRADEKAFLGAYFEKYFKVNSKKLTLYKVIYKELWRLWFLKLDSGEL